MWGLEICSCFLPFFAVFFFLYVHGEHTWCGSSFAGSFVAVEDAVIVLGRVISTQAGQTKVKIGGKCVVRMKTKDNIALRYAHTNGGKTLMMIFSH